METVTGCADSSHITRRVKLKNRMLKKTTIEGDNHEKNKNGRSFFTKNLFGKFVAAKFPNHRYTYFPGKLKLVLHFGCDKLSDEFTLFV